MMMCVFHITSVSVHCVVASDEVRTLTSRVIIIVHVHHNNTAPSQRKYQRYKL